MSWDDFLKIKKELHESKYPFYIFPASDYEGLICCYIEILLSREARLLYDRRVSF